MVHDITSTVKMKNKLLLCFPESATLLYNARKKEKRKKVKRKRKKLQMKMTIVHNCTANIIY